MIDDSNMSCCGLREISFLADFKTPEAAMQEFLEDTTPRESYYGGAPYRRDKFRYAVFSGIKRGRKKGNIYVDNFAAFITKNKLGTVMETDWNKNPNTGNNLKVCVWTIDWDAVKGWADKHKDKTNGKGKPSPAVAPADIV